MKPESIAEENDEDILELIFKVKVRRSEYDEAKQAVVEALSNLIDETTIHSIEGFSTFEEVSEEVEPEDE